MKSCDLLLQLLRIAWIWILCSGFGGYTVQGQYRSPRITEHPKDVLVKKNEPTTLNCKAEGKPDPIIEWYKDGELLNNSPSNDGRRIFLPGGDLFFLSVSDGKKESDSGTYWCIARNQVGNVRSRNATLQVGVIRDDFRALPQNTRVLVGETVTLKCQPPKGSPEPQVLWQKNGQTVETRLASSRLQSADGGNLIIKDARATDAGRYQCVAINIAGSRTSPEVLLSVHQKPYFTREPEDVTVLVGDAATFYCQVEGMPEPEVQWYRQDAGMPNGRADRIDGGLRIKDTRPEDEGLYFCQASNDLGSVRASALLSVHSRPKFLVKPKESVRVGLNGVAKFECSASGNPTPTTYWRKEGSQELFFPSSSYGRLHISPEGTLRIQGVKKEDSGIYVCSALSPAGSRDAEARLEVTSQEQTPPPIILIGPSNQTLPLKSMASVPCEVVGTPVPVIKWLKDGMELASQSERITISPNGTLQINDLRASDSGQYTCVASSVSGETSASGSLSVESPTNPNIAFRRTNPSLLPPAPAQPMVVNETQPTSITLSWTWTAKQAPTRSQHYLGFTLETFSPDLQTGWVNVGHRLYQTARPGDVIVHTVEGLKPDTSYMFLVRSENPEGFSAPSPASTMIKTRASTRRPDQEDIDEEEARNQLATSDIELINAEPASSTSIRISWKVAKSSLKYIDGYYIRYREISAGQSFKGYNILTVVAQKSDLGTYSHVIPNVKKFMQYDVFVSPFFKSVEGQPSNSKSVITSEDKPSAPPQNLLGKMMNETAASVKWSPPLPPHHNGVLTGYSVEVRGNDSRIHAEMDFGANISSIVLNNLTLGRVYLVRVCAFTSVGSGPYSPPLTITMDPLSLDLVNGNGHNGVTAEEGASQILKEVWFIILMGCLLFIFLLLLIIILYTRRKSHGKKDHISSVVVAPHTDSQFVSGKQSLWIDQRWRPTETSDKDSNRSEAKLLSNHIHPNGDMLTTEATDYAEVDPQNLTTFYNNSNKGQMMLGPQPDLTPYATTTLIQQRRPNYDPLPGNGLGVTLGKNLADSGIRDSDQFSSGRSKLSMASNNFSKFKSSHSSPSPSPSAPMKMMPMSSRMGGCYPSPGPNRSHLVPMEQPMHHAYAYNGTHNHLPHHGNSHANENLYHIGEIFAPNKSASVSNGFSEAVYQSGDPEDSNFLPQQTMCPLIDREIQSSLPSLASDSTSCNLYAEADDVIPQSSSQGNSYIINSGCNGIMTAGRNGGVGGPVKNSRSTSPAYSSDSFNSGKSGNKRFYNKSNKKKFDNNCKSLERRHLAPLLPGRNPDAVSYPRPCYPELNGFQKLARFPRPTVSQSHLDNEFPEWEHDNGTTVAAVKLAKSLKESNA
ncbi:unnamed protein product [Allacma fusca]|uniref:Uncharacterized protein n=1 Tax=Allacma fusca TaxID=39272 RepID=A0A8J2LAW2_9HEXA|nr:unnamed protein product [Allacma fusca]